MSQTSINAAGQPIGVAGQLLDSMEGRDIVSKFNEGTTQMPFGCGVIDGSADDGVLMPSTLSDTVVGINVWNANHVPAATLANGQVTGDLGATGLLQYAGLQVLRRGRILALIDASSPTINSNVDRPYMRAVATGSYQAGAFAATSNASYMIDLTKVGVFTTSVKTAADGVAKVAGLEVNFTNKP